MMNTLISHVKRRFTARHGGSQTDLAAIFIKIKRRAAASDTFERPDGWMRREQTQLHAQHPRGEQMKQSAK